MTKLSQNCQRFVILCTCLDTPSDITVLWHLPNVSSAFKTLAHFLQIWITFTPLQALSPKQKHVKSFVFNFSSLHWPGNSSDGALLIDNDYKRGPRFSKSIFKQIHLTQRGSMFGMNTMALKQTWRLFSFPFSSSCKYENKPQEVLN